MFISLNVIFEGYTPITVLAACSYREAYHSIDKSGQDVALIAYDMKALPDCLQGRKIPEFELIEQLSGDAFPTCLERGIFVDGSVSIAWMSTTYLGNMMLEEFVLSANMDYVEELLQKFYDFLVAVKEISWRLGCRCCKIPIDSVIVSKDLYEDFTLCVVGLDRISCADDDNAAYDISLGIILSYLLQTCNQCNSILKTIVERAVSPVTTERYMCVEDFADAVAKYLCRENVNSFECFQIP